jgi:hypothetical protein
MTYSHDLDDLDFDNPITPVGIRGQIDIIIDHREFFPVSAMSKLKRRHQKGGFLQWATTDIFQWFALPAEEIIYVCCGMTGKEYLDRYQEFPMITEQQAAVAEESDSVLVVRSWIRFTHEFCRQHGSDLFSTAGGWSGFEAAEAISTVKIANRLMLFVSMRYRSIDRRGTGQVICAVEFRDDDFSLVNFYNVYSTGTFNRGSVAGFAPLARMILPLVRSKLLGF